MFSRIIQHIKSKNDTVGAILQWDKNNFGLLRLMAALGVIFGHSFVLFESDIEEPTRAFLHFTYIGTLAVDFFFFLSGILVTASFINSSSPVDFIIKRVGRLWPALIFCVLVSTIIIGPLYSDLNWKDYFTSSETAKYFVTNILQYNAWKTLPGVFTRNFFFSDVNGSLWTLQPEILAYFFTLIVGLMLLLRHRKLFLVASALIILSFFIKSSLLIFAFGDTDKVYFFFFFLAGMNIYLFREIIVINPYLSFCLIILWLFCRSADNTYTHLIFFVAFLYGALALGKSRFFTRLRIKGDYSYGVYIYGCPVQQCFQSSFPQMQGCTSMLFTVPVILILGMLSWYFIEKPVLKYIKNRGKNKLLTATGIR